MNKAQLINEVVAAGELTKKQAAAAFDTMVEAITKALEAGEKVQLSGFGTFAIKTRNERSGRNPRTGEIVTIPASKYPAFTASKALKQKFN